MELTWSASWPVNWLWIVRCVARCAGNDSIYADSIGVCGGRCPTWVTPDSIAAPKLLAAITQTQGPMGWHDYSTFFLQHRDAFVFFNFISYGFKVVEPKCVLLRVKYLSEI